LKVDARRVAVAASGGRDSTALLHCTVRQAAPLGVEVVALHVHHGLMAAADDWLLQVQAQARRWGAGFRAHRLQGGPDAGSSVEAWARRERYKALATMAQAAGCTLVLLAHHRRDQAETWLLQALRGGGPAGLSAMPTQAAREGLQWCRPWLDQPRQAIDAYVRRHRLRFIEDESNADPRYARNRLRRHVWPALTQAFADAETALAGAARRAQESQALAAEAAAVDLPPLLVDSGVGACGLQVLPWLQLPPARRANALRFWLREVLAEGAPETLVQRLLDELGAQGGGSSRSGACWPAPQGELQLHRGVLRHARARAAAGPAVTPAQAPPPPTPLAVDLSRPGLWHVPAWAGSFDVQRVAERGAPAALLRQARLQPRQGGEQFALQARATPRSLKKQYQSLEVPRWQRDGPLVWTAGDELLFVPALGIDARHHAMPGEDQCSLRWVPDTGP
jgi:tRNA(Ile)-lysidine synthase